MALKAKSDATDTVLLELAFYKRYERMKVYYETGKVYRFTAVQAVELLEEQDTGRSIWRVHRTVTPEISPALAKAAAIVDQTEKVLPAQPVSDDPTEPAKKRIEIGNDEEIESILKTGDIVTI